MSASNRLNRRGSLTLIVLVCLTVCTSVMGARIHASIQYRRHLLLQHATLQTDWLLRAGVDRAKRAILLNSEAPESDAGSSVSSYDGETWTLEQPPGRIESAVITIRVSDGTPSMQRVQVIAESKLAPDVIIRRSHAFNWPIPQRNPNPSTESDES